MSNAIMMRPCSGEMRHPKKLIVLDMVDGRLELAKAFGADEVWNPGKMDVVKAIMEITEGYGCDK
jgi:threonine dehydrogenase-like Zn-dependent dehydrogenase